MLLCEFILNSKPILKIFLAHFVGLRVHIKNHCFRNWNFLFIFIFEFFLQILDFIIYEMFGVDRI